MVLLLVLHAREGVLLVHGPFVPRGIVEDEQGQGKNHCQNQWVSNDLAPALWKVGGFRIAVLEQIGDGREVLSLFLARGDDDGLFVAFGFFACHDGFLSVGWSRI